MVKIAEYIWLDGNTSTQEVRSKARVIQIKDGQNATLKNFPEWSFDGSSTNQAVGHSSDLILNPVSFIKDPIRGNDNYLVMCEVLNPDRTPHETNTRSKLRFALENGAAEQDPYFGFEKEYTLFQGRQPLGWPQDGFPQPQGPFYCGVGSDKVFGRELIEEHLEACVEAGLLIYGINAEVMPAQWEFQIGYRGFENDQIDPLTTCDHLWFAVWLIQRLGEEHNIRVSFDNKPVKGDWNGAGCHTNFSTKAMRDPKTGKKAIDDAVERLRAKHMEHIEVYGDALHERLTGHHETCRIDQFRAGNSDRGASIRIPIQVAEKGYGYMEDRRPGANSNPYTVAAKLLETVCGVSTKSKQKEAVLA